MRRRNEKTTKQMEGEELARLTGAHDDRATAQLDTAELRALLDREPPVPPAPLVEAPIGTGTMPRTATLAAVAATAEATVEPSVEPSVEVAAPRPTAPSSRVPWGPLIAVIVAAAALVAVLVLR
jgi:hypothetical protein